MSVKIRCVIALSGCSIFLALIVLLSACNKSEKAAAAGNTQTTFSSPEEAGKALIAAAKSGDQNTVLAMFGPDSKDVIYTGDAAQDKEIAEAFVSAYQVMNRWRKLDDNTEVLLIGADNFAFPIPLKKNNGGQWYFDTKAGRDEILARRIGRNELAAIEICGALADAQNEYFSRRHDGAHEKTYALKFVSDNGKENGLYWGSPEGAPRSPLGPLVAFATSEGYEVQQNSHKPFHGYYFRMLHKQGTHAEGGSKEYVVDGKMVNGFAFVAYPAEYGKSGIMTFIINQKGVVYQKDLGNNTVEMASSIDEFDPDDTWASVQ
jgi:hypothetical protein